MKRVLVTGANGFIGRHCVETLVKGGFDVYAACYGTVDEKLPEVHYFDLDLRDGSAVKARIAATAPEYLLHLAWYVEPSSYVHSDENISWLNYSLKLIESFREAGGRRLVTVGTCMEYARSDVPISETAPLCCDSLYSAAKSALFGLAGAYAAKYGLSFAHARLFYLFGPGESKQRIVPYVMDMLCRSKRVDVSHGRQIRDYMYVKDVSSALSAVLCSDTEGAVNIGSGKGVELRELFGLIEETAGKDGLINLGSVPARPDEKPVIVADNAKLLATGWSQRYSLSDGISEMMSMSADDQAH